MNSLTHELLKHGVYFQNIWVFLREHLAGSAEEQVTLYHRVVNSRPTLSVEITSKKKNWRTSQISFCYWFLFLSSIWVRLKSHLEFHNGILLIAFGQIKFSIICGTILRPEVRDIKASIVSKVRVLSFIKPTMLLCQLLILHHLHKHVLSIDWSKVWVKFKWDSSLLPFLSLSPTILLLYLTRALDLCRSVAEGHPSKNPSFSPLL